MWGYTNCQYWLWAKDMSPCILLSSTGQKQEPREEWNKHAVLLHTSSTSLGQNLPSEPGPVSVCSVTVSLCSLPWACVKLSKLGLYWWRKLHRIGHYGSKKLTHFVCEIRTAPHWHESVYICSSSPSALFFTTSNNVKPAGNIVFPGHLRNTPAAPQRWPPAPARAAHVLASSFLSFHQLFIYDRQLPYYVRGCSGEGSCLKSFLKSDYSL